MCKSCRKKYGTFMKERIDYARQHPELLYGQIVPRYVSKPQALLCLALWHRLDTLIEWEHKVPYDNDATKFRTIDIAIPKAMLYIEVHGRQHAEQAKVVISDMKRAFYNDKDGYLTLNVFNDALKENFCGVVNCVCIIAYNRMKKQKDDENEDVAEKLVEEQERERAVIETEFWLTLIAEGTLNQMQFAELKQIITNGVLWKSYHNCG
jgi:hypothetical protein